MADSDRLVDLIFEKEQPESVDFEIAFTALIATATLASLNSESQSSLIISFCALGLLVLTLVRRMGVIGQYTQKESILNKTIRPIELLTIVCVFQIVISALDMIEKSATGVYVVSLVVIIAVILVAVLQEMLFRDYRLWWGAAFFTKGIAVQDGMDRVDSIHRLLLRILAGFYYRIAFLLLREPEVLPDEDIEKWNRLRDFIDEMENGEQTSPNTVRLFFAISIILLVVYGIVSLLLSLTGIPLIDGLLLIIAVVAVRHLIGFWYLAYGSQNLSRFLQTNTHHLVTMGIYGGVNYWIFYM
jgi:hypothetical protein